MELIDKVLTASSDFSSDFSLAIRAALTIGKRTLDKYHNKTGESEVYRIAMSMSLLHSKYVIYSDYITMLCTSSPSPSSQARVLQKT